MMCVAYLSMAFYVGWFAWFAVSHSASSSCNDLPFLSRFMAVPVWERNGGNTAGIGEFSICVIFVICWLMAKRLFAVCLLMAKRLFAIIFGKQTTKNMLMEKILFAISAFFVVCWRTAKMDRADGKEIANGKDRPHTRQRVTTAGAITFAIFGLFAVRPHLLCRLPDPWADDKGDGVPPPH